MIITKWTMSNEEIINMSRSEEGVKNVSNIKKINYYKYVNCKYISSKSSKNNFDKNIIRLYNNKYTPNEIMETERDHIKVNMLIRHDLGASILQPPYAPNKYNLEKYEVILKRYQETLEVMEKYNKNKINIYYKSVFTDEEADRIVYSLFYIEKYIYVWFSYFYSHKENNCTKEFLSKDERIEVILETNKFYKELKRKYNKEVLYEEYNFLPNF